MVSRQCEQPVQRPWDGSVPTAKGRSRRWSQTTWGLVGHRRTLAFFIWGLLHAKCFTTELYPLTLIPFLWL
jgi:hypothetical protein